MPRGSKNGSSAPRSKGLVPQMGKRIVSRVAHGAALCVLVVGGRVVRGSFDGQTDSTAIQAVNSLTGEVDEKSDIEVVSIDHGCDEQELVDATIDAGFNSVEEYLEAEAQADEEDRQSGEGMILEDSDEEPQDIYTAIAEKYSVVDDGTVVRMKVCNVVTVRRVRTHWENWRSAEQSLGDRWATVDSYGSSDPWDDDWRDDPWDDSDADEDEFRSDWERTYAPTASDMFAEEPPRVPNPTAKARRIEDLQMKIRRAELALYDAQYWRREEAEKIRRRYRHNPSLMGMELAELESEPKTAAEFRAADRLIRLCKRLDRMVNPVSRGLNAAMFVVAKDLGEDREALSVLLTPLTSRLSGGQRHAGRKLGYERHLALRRGLGKPVDYRIPDITGTVAVPVDKRHRQHGRGEKQQLLAELQAPTPSSEDWKYQYLNWWRLTASMEVRHPHAFRHEAMQCDFCQQSLPAGREFLDVLGSTMSPGDIVTVGTGHRVAAVA